MLTNTGKHKIWICIRKWHIFIKLTDKKIDNIFAICRGKEVGKRSKIKRELTKKKLILAYMPDLSDLVFSEFWVLEDLYRLIKDEVDQIIMKYEKRKGRI